MEKNPRELSLFFYVIAASTLQTLVPRYRRWENDPKNCHFPFMLLLQNTSQTLVVCISWYRIWQNETPSFYSYSYDCTLVQTFYMYWTAGLACNGDFRIPTCICATTQQWQDSLCKRQIKALFDLCHRDFSLKIPQIFVTCCQQCVSKWYILHESWDLFCRKQSKVIYYLTRKSNLTKKTNIVKLIYQ